MSYHNDSSSEFLGLRTTRNGRMQVVYDARTGNRVVLDIEPMSTPKSEIDAALKEGIGARNVLGGVLSALKARNIGVDFAASAI